MASKNDSTLLDSGRQAQPNDSVTFAEEMQEDGSLAVSWSECSSKTWRAVLEAIKTMIPPGHRAYKSESKLWLISSSHQQTWQEIKRAFSNDENIDVRAELESRVTEESLAELLRGDYSRLPSGMKKRAMFAIKATLGFIDAPVEYSSARDDFGAYDAETERWYYTDGRYSGTSPSAWDEKQMRRAYDKLARVVEQIPDFLTQLDQEVEYAWKVRFRAAMLERYNYRCYICGIYPEDLSKLHMHRVIPGKDGGEYIENNVVILCPGCHHRHEGLSWDDIHAARLERAA